jgi:hypothetical protein
MMRSRFISSMKNSFLRQLLGVHRTPIAENRTVRALRRCNEVVEVVASCSISGGTGVAAHLIEEPGSRLVNVEFGGWIDTEPSVTYEPITIVCIHVA